MFNNDVMEIRSTFKKGNSMNQWNYYMCPNLAHIRHSQPNNGMSDQIMILFKEKRNHHQIRHQKDHPEKIHYQHDDRKEILNN